MKKILCAVAVVVCLAVVAGAVNVSYAETASQRNAVRAARDYLDFMSFSKQGLIQQLEFDGYSNEDAVYGTDQIGADWKEQAARKAEEYNDLMPFSRQGLIEQLEYEGFTHEEAVYGVDSIGL